MSRDLRGSVSHESGISPAKMLAKDAIKGWFGQSFEVVMLYFPVCGGVTDLSVEVHLE